MAEIVLRKLWKYELAAICGISLRTLHRELTAHAKETPDFGPWKGKRMLTKAQVKSFLIKIDILPETINL